MIRQRKPIARRTPLPRNQKPIKRSPLKRVAYAIAGNVTTKIKRTRLKSSKRTRAKVLAEAVFRAIIRLAVWARADRCECCGNVNADEMHEAYSRARTKRMVPERRFNTAWCVRLCHRCHALQTDNLCVILFRSLELGANGGMVFVEKTAALLMPATLFTAEQVWRYHDARWAA